MPPAKRRRGSYEETRGTYEQWLLANHGVDLNAPYRCLAEVDPRVSQPAGLPGPMPVAGTAAHSTGCMYVACMCACRIM